MSTNVATTKYLHLSCVKCQQMSWHYNTRTRTHTHTHGKKIGTLSSDICKCMHMA